MSANKIIKTVGYTNNKYKKQFTAVNIFSSIKSTEFFFQKKILLYMSLYSMYIYGAQVVCINQKHMNSLEKVKYWKTQQSLMNRFTCVQFSFSKENVMVSRINCRLFLGMMVVALGETLFNN